MNCITLVGRLATAPEGKSLPSGKSVTSFRFAVQNTVSKKTSFFSVVAYNAPAEFINGYLEKGQRISIQGRLESRSYEVEVNGVMEKREKIEIIAEQVQSLEAVKSTIQQGSNVGQQQMVYA